MNLRNASFPSQNPDRRRWFFCLLLHHRRFNVANPAEINPNVDFPAVLSGSRIFVFAGIKSGVTAEGATFAPSITCSLSEHHLIRGRDRITDRNTDAIRRMKEGR